MWSQRRRVAITVAPAAGLMGETAAQQQQAEFEDDIKTLVSRLSLEEYKATLKGLTQFGDRLQGTQRNRDAIDWVEAQLKAVGCTTTERIDYVFDPPPREGGRRRGSRELNPSGGTPTGALIGRNGSGPGGSSIFGYRGPTGVNNDAMAQPDEALRELNREPATNGPRQEVYCTKIGNTHPDEMYIIGARHGAGSHSQRSGRRNHAFDSLCSLEQRRNGAQRLARVRRAAQGPPR